MLKAKTRWELQKTESELVKTLADSLELTPFIAALLVNRGITSEKDAYDFLKIEEQAFHDPYMLDGMKETIERIEEAIEKEEKILIFGDYDADGVSSTTIMMKALTEKHAKVDFYIPNRFTEGYGPNENAFRKAKELGYSVIITVDTGISAIGEAKLAKDLGIDLIITDHHEPQPELPVAYAIVHPKKPGSTYPFRDLAGAGVALKVAHALLGHVPKELLEIATIGTIADLVPLKDENRLLARKGLQALRSTTNKGLRALLKLCSVQFGSIDEETIGFVIGPRINAAGRLDAADPAVFLLLTEDEEEAAQLAEEINTMNEARQKIVNKMTEEAIEIVERDFPPDQHDVLIVAKEGWNPGVIGIVASRLVDRYYRPTIVMSVDEEKGLAKGSARSIDGFDMFKNLSECRDILPHFGGHPMAAGMTLEHENVGELRQRLNKLAREQLTEEDFIPKTNVELTLDVEEVSLELIERMHQLKPFGVGNPKPRVVIRESAIREIRKIGSDKSHLKATLDQNGQSLDAIGFGFGHVYESISPLAALSIVGELTVNEWNGFRKPQIMVQDLAVESWQLFDWRGTNNLNSKLHSMMRDPVQLVAFRHDTVDKLGLDEMMKDILFIPDSTDIPPVERHSGSMIILDLPYRMNQMEALFEAGLPERLYAVFHHKEDHFLSTLPTREHFKWFYAFLLKQKSFDLKRYGDELARRKGWSKGTVDFMSQVFFELEFVKIKDGLISLNEKPAKRDIESAETYQLKKEQLKIEKELYYSSYRSLKEWFDQAYASTPEMSVSK